MVTSTQIGGKYDPADDTIFVLKRRLQRLGITVSHPIADRFITQDGDRGYAFDPAVQSFAEVEKDYYDRIANSDFHIVCNKSHRTPGYIGESATLETCHAILAGRPIILLHSPTLRPDTPDSIRHFLEGRLSLLILTDLLTIPDEEVISLVEAIKGRSVDYRVTAEERATVENYVHAMFRRLTGR